MIGLGRIGRAVAERAIGFGMTITYHNRQSTIDLILRFRTC
ncbi:MAG: NAD(P)-dependent oxidoreductase [Nocardioidaceae bacterium]